ncbi:MAG TPA: hypothetical protein PLH15_10580 [Spirochaetota bacterium]|nr:hypothetical protein [Spirochaetota bacterium]
MGNYNGITRSQALTINAGKKTRAAQRANKRTTPKLPGTGKF